MKEQKPEVPEKARQVSEVRSRWEWAESSVWTNRMLEALEKGIDGVKETKRKCFDNIPHDRLLERIEEKVADGKLLELVRRFLKQSIMEDGVAKGPEEEGTPQGATLSPLLCNIYLNPLDHLMEKAGLRMIRYADDLVVLCHTAEEAEHAMELLEKWTIANGLELHPEKTDTVDMAEQGSHFDFLGYRFKRTRKGKLDRFPSPKSEKRFRQKLQRETKRNNGRSLEEIVRRCNRIIRGWFEYFKHASKWSLKTLDSWVRMRLRSILRKRSNRRGRGRGSDHQRWPNAYFANAGLFSMYAAWREASSPQRG